MSDKKQIRLWAVVIVVSLAIMLGFIAYSCSYIKKQLELDIATVSAKVLEEQLKGGDGGNSHPAYTLKLEIEGKVYYGAVVYNRRAADWAICPGDTIKITPRELNKAEGSALLYLRDLIVEPKESKLVPIPDLQLWPHPGPGKGRRGSGPHKAPLRAGAIAI